MEPRPPRDLLGHRLADQRAHQPYVLVVVRVGQICRRRRAVACLPLLARSWVGPDGELEVLGLRRVDEEGQIRPLLDNGRDLVRLRIRDLDRARPVSCGHLLLLGPVHVARVLLRVALARVLANAPHGVPRAGPAREHHRAGEQGAVESRDAAAATAGALPRPHPVLLRDLRRGDDEGRVRGDNDRDHPQPLEVEHHDLRAVLGRDHVRRGCDDARLVQIGAAHRRKPHARGGPSDRNSSAALLLHPGVAELPGRDVVRGRHGGVLDGLHLGAVGAQPRPHDRVQLDHGIADATLEELLPLPRLRDLHSGERRRADPRWCH
mmetsp:Transcript_21005/g.59620  ORF Transcript_21005/g.59620 Transcript_21005/m.59620 type:complete len:321 (-) Transcript_21005:828-1790(-)